tara:strand:- start:4366 stop:6018 length:1653 start_codon:yes stop_codon:yes gene_type:complete
MNQRSKYNINDYQAYLSEGLNFAKNSNYEEAQSSFKKAINLNKKKYEAYINLSNIYLLKNMIKKSKDLLFSYLKKNGNEINIANHLGKICIKYNLDNDIIKLFNFFNLEKIDKKKDKKFLYFLQGQFNEKKSKPLSAIISYKNTISCDAHFFESYPKLLNLLESTNDILNFKKYLDIGYLKFNEGQNKDILILYECILLNRTFNYKKSEQKIKKNKLYEKFTNKTDFLILLLDLQSKNNEKLKNFDDAFEKVKLRNKYLINHRTNSKFNIDVMSNTIDKYKSFFKRNVVESITQRLSYNDDSNLVFLVGFPRSGTTLLDTILRTHSKIRVLEEKPYLLDLRHKYFSKNNNDLLSLINIKQDEKDYIRKAYFQKLKLNNIEKNNIIIDKLPLSIIEIGFIKCIFPNSRIILALRHPCDAVISCFFSSFKINEAMVNFLSWENTINFYNKVFDLFDFYEKEFDLEYFKIKYEDIVFDFKTQITSLVNYLDLKYEKKLENFYLTAKERKKISTPSYNQVIKPIYTSSIDRWKNYKEIKNPQNQLKKWIEKFNY